MGLKVHGLPYSTCTCRVLATCVEKGVEYELVPVDIVSGVHKQHPFLSLNPFGLIPALQDGDLTLFESRAITKYVATKYKRQGADLLKLENLADAGRVNVWVEVEAEQFNPVVEPLVYELLIKPHFLQQPTDEAAVESLAEKLGKVLDVYEEKLSKSKYLAGDFYSLADLHHQSYMHYLMKTDKASVVASRPRVLAWWKDISSRPAWLKAVEGMKLPA